MKIQEALDLIDELCHTAEREHDMAYYNSTSASTETYKKMIDEWHALDHRISELRDAIESQDITY